MTAAITFTVKGRPRPKGRGRHVGARVVSTTSKHERVWRGAVERAARGVVANLGGVGAVPWLAGALRVDMAFAMPTNRRERHGLPHTNRPDVDNLQKLVLDAMEAAGLLARGDARVAAGDITKSWAAAGGVTVTVQPANIQVAGINDDDGIPAWLADHN